MVCFGGTNPDLIPTVDGGELGLGREGLIGSGEFELEGLAGEGGPIGSYSLSFGRLLGPELANPLCIWAPKSSVKADGGGFEAFGPVR